MSTVVCPRCSCRQAAGAAATNGFMVLTPEPGTLALAGTGLWSLAGMIRRKKTV